MKHPLAAMASMSSMASMCHLSPWEPLLSSSILSDVTVVIGDSLENDLTASTINSVEHNNTFRLHRFPLFARSEFFKQRCEEAKDVCHVTFELPWDMIPSGYSTLKEIVDFCYGLSPNLTADNVADVIAAADNLGMTEEYSANNLVKLCEDFLKVEVYSSWESSLSLLENVKETTLGTGIIDDVLRNCQEVVLEYALLLNEQELESTVFEVKVLFRRLLALSPTILQGFLQGVRSKKLSFVYIGNYLAEKDYTMVLPDECLLPSQVSEDFCSSDDPADNASFSEYTQIKQWSILDCLVESLGFSMDGFKWENEQFQISYVVTLLKYCHKLKSKYAIILQEFLSTKLDRCSLADLQALELTTVVSLISDHFSTEIVKGTSNVSSLEDGKMFSNGTLVDKYILWAASHDEGFQLSDLQTLVETVPGSFRKTCDTLYDGIDAFLERNPDVTSNDVIRLCDSLDPFKLSEVKTEKAIQNPRIPLQPGFFTTLYLAQNKKFKGHENLISTLQAEVEGLQAQMEALRGDLKIKDSRIAELLVKNARLSSVPLVMEPSIQISCQFPIACLAVVPDGTIWVGGKTLSCWRNDKCIWTAEPKYSSFLVLSFNGELLWAGFGSGKILLVENFKVIGEVKGHDFSVTALWATSNKCCFSGGIDTKFKKWMWDGNSISCGWTCPEGEGHKRTITAFCEDVNGKLWSAGADGTIKCWENWKCVKTLSENSVYVGALAVGKFLFVGRVDGIISCWTLDGKLVKRLDGKSPIWALGIDKDGVLWSGSSDHFIRGWKGPWEDGTCIAVLNGHKDSVYALALTVENSLWSGSSDGAVIKWKAGEVP